MARVSKRGWIILSPEKRARYRSFEFSSVVENRGVLVRLSGNTTMATKADIFLKSSRKLLALLDSHDPPLIVTLRQGGQLQVTWPPEGGPN